MRPRENGIRRGAGDEAAAAVEGPGNSGVASVIRVAKPETPRRCPTCHCDKSREDWETASKKLKCLTCLGCGGVFFAYVEFGITVPLCLSEVTIGRTLIADEPMRRLEDMPVAVTAAELSGQTWERPANSDVMGRAIGNAINVRPASDAGFMRGSKFRVGKVYGADKVKPAPVSVFAEGGDAIPVAVFVREDGSRFTMEMHRQGEGFGTGPLPERATFEGIVVKKEPPKPKARPWFPPARTFNPGPLWTWVVSWMRGTYPEDVATSFQQDQTEQRIAAERGRQMRGRP